MNLSRFKRNIALLLTLAYASVYLVFPAEGYAFGGTKVYAAGSLAGSSSVRTSQTAALTISSQPQNITAAPGTVVTFFVAAQGSGKLTYQWYYKKAGAADWSLWKGHTTAVTSAAVNETWNLMKVRCRVTDNSGSVYSQAATISVKLPLKVITQPKNVTAKPGASVRFTVAAQGTGKLTYQWYYKKAGAADWSLWNGRITASTVSTANSTWNLMKVRCLISDATGSKIYSNAATVTIDQPLTVLTHPKDITVKAGSSVTFAVEARGTGKLTYQWYFKKAGVADWTPWNGRITASTVSTANSTWNLMKVRCLISDAAGSKVYSQAATVTIDQPLTIITQPVNMTIKAGETAKFSVKAQGTGALKYQWYYKKAGAASPSAWNGRIYASFSVAANTTWDGMTVFCRITDASGASIDTDTIELIVPGKLRIARQPENTTIQIGETAQFSITAYCSDTLRYQWYYKKAGKGDWTLWSGQTSPSVSATADCTWHGMQVYCAVTDSNNNTLKSSVAYAMITKQGDKRYFSRTIRVKNNNTNIYSNVGTGSPVVARVQAGTTFNVRDWSNDANDTTWYSFAYNGGIAWIPRTSVSSTIYYSAMPERRFADGGIPVIYLSPSRQTANLYKVGNTTEQQQMYRVAESLKNILENEYYCSVYIPPVSQKVGLYDRAYDAYIRDSDVYLAIHSNSVPKGAIMHGAQCYYYPECAQSIQLAQGIIDEMAKIEFRRSIVAQKMVNGMTAYDNTGYGEVRDPSYYGMISVLAEVEYHHYEEPARWIINNTDRIARALANSLERTLSLQKK